MLTENDIYQKTDKNNKIWFCFDLPNSDLMQGFQTLDIALNQIRLINNKEMRDLKDLEALKLKELETLKVDNEIKSYFKPLTPLTFGRLKEFLSVKTYLNGDKSKIYTRFELLKVLISENNFNNTLMDKAIIKNNLKINGE